MSSQAMAQATLPVESPLGSEETHQRIISFLKEKNIQIFSEINHSEEAHKIHLPLLPTRLIIFGSPEVGTLLMQKKQSVGIDLPLKILITEDTNGKTWVRATDIQELSKKHQLVGHPVIKKIDTLIKNIFKQIQN